MLGVGGGISEGKVPGEEVEALGAFIRVLEENVGKLRGRLNQYSEMLRTGELVGYPVTQGKGGEPLRHLFAPVRSPHSHSWLSCEAKRALDIPISPRRPHCLTTPLPQGRSLEKQAMPETTDFLAVLVFDRGDGWASVQPHVFSASHPEIAYRLALARGQGASGSQRFVGFAELSVAPAEFSTTGEMTRKDPADLVKAKDDLLVFQDARWQGVPFDRAELRSALQGPVITHGPRGLDRIEWERLDHAYGSAQDVPYFIRSLGAEDPDVRGEAFQALLMTILHQGSLYTATVAAIPFLLRIAEDPDHPARLETMDLVRMIAKECCFEGYHRRRSDAQREGEVVGGAGNEEPDVVGAIHRLFQADVSLLKELAWDEDPYIRDMAESVLGELKIDDSSR